MLQAPCVGPTLHFFGMTFPVPRGTVSIPDSFATKGSHQVKLKCSFSGRAVFDGVGGHFGVGGAAHPLGSYPSWAHRTPGAEGSARHVQRPSEAVPVAFKILERCLKTSLCGVLGGGEGQAFLMWRDAREGVLATVPHVLRVHGPWWVNCVTARGRWGPPRLW